MNYKKLGKSNLNVSVIGFGGIPIQRITKNETVPIIQKAMELGINYIDTARGYTVSEEYIGNALKGIRDKWIVATKSMARTKDGIIKDVDISLNNLQTEYIDLYQIHNVKEMDTYKQVTSEDGALIGLLAAKKEGKIGHIGITAHSLDTLKVAIESNLFETIMYPYNIVETQADELFKRAYEQNIGVIAMKPMAGGALDNGTLAMRFILQNKNITSAIPGMASIREVEENVKAADNISPLTEDEIKQCSDITNKLGKNFCRRCGYCAPCPQGIDIPSCFIMKSYYDNYDLKDWAEGRYKAMKSHAGNCRECGQCEKKCPYSLPIRKMLKEVKKTFSY